LVGAGAIAAAVLFFSHSDASIAPNLSSPLPLANPVKADAISKRGEALARHFGGDGKAALQLKTDQGTDPSYEERSFNVRLGLTKEGGQYRLAALVNDFELPATVAVPLETLVSGNAFDLDFRPEKRNVRGLDITLKAKARVHFDPQLGRFIVDEVQATAVSVVPSTNVVLDTRTFSFWNLVSDPV
jgi:hypothetical protein